MPGSGAGGYALGGHKRAALGKLRSAPGLPGALELERQTRRRSSPWSPRHPQSSFVKMEGDGRAFSGLTGVVAFGAVLVG